jgi:hypothetical protein
MFKKARGVAAFATGAALVLAWSIATADAASASTPAAYTCTGGEIPSGTYSSITVTGACAPATDAVINVVHGISVSANAIFDAQSAPSTITVGGNVTAMSGSLLGLGCQPDLAFARHPCTVEPTASSTITVKGNVSAVGANTVLINGSTVKGNVTLIGGGGDLPWSVKNNMIGRNLTIMGVTSEFMVVLRNTIGGNATLINITETDTDPNPAVEIVVNKIGGNLVCFGLSPRAAGGFIPGQVNTVGGKSVGQCANLISG